MKFSIFGRMYENTQELIGYYTNTPINILIIHHLLTFCVAMILILIYLLTKAYPFYPKSFKYSMVEPKGVYVARSEDGEIDLVSGSFKHFLSSECDVSEYSDEELNGLILEYCKYVDKVYGKSPEFAQKNFGKDYKALLNGDLT